MNSKVLITSFTENSHGDYFISYIVQYGTLSPLHYTNTLNSVFDKKCNFNVDLANEIIKLLDTMRPTKTNIHLPASYIEDDGTIADASKKVDTKTVLKSTSAFFNATKHINSLGNAVLVTTAQSKEFYGKLKKQLTIGKKCRKR